MRAKFLSLGIGFGLLFPLIGLLSDCFLFNDLPFSLDAIGNRILENPIHFIILSAPLVLGMTFYFIGKSGEKREKLNAELVRTNAQMKVNNDLLDTFNYHVSHDLKTLLNNQLVLSKMLQKYLHKGDPNKAGEIAEKLVESGDNGLATVKSFLKISEEGFVSNTEMNKSIHVGKELDRILEENGLKDQATVQLEESGFSEIEIGPKVFESIALNLITNSIKYNDNEPKIVISLNRTEKGKQIIFQDNGIGIDMESNKEYLFKPFNRIENNKNTEGTGIGLYLVLKMVNSLGGEIEVESELGKGSRFILNFFE